MDEEQRAAIMDLPEPPNPRSADVESPAAVVQTVYESVDVEA